MVKRSWHIRLLREGEERALYELEKAVRGVQALSYEDWLAKWRWWYRGSPYGDSQVWVAVDGNEIVGHYPLMTLRLVVDGAEMLAVQNTDLMTHPAYRRQGVFVALKSHGLGEAAEEGREIEFGFPNRASLAGHSKTGSLYLGRLHRAVKVYNWEAVLGHFVRRKALRRPTGYAGRMLDVASRLAKAVPQGDIEVGEVAVFDSSVEELCRSLASKYRVSVLRSREFLNWRYSNPLGEFLRLVATRGSNTVGYAVVSVCDMDGLQMGTVLDCVGEGTPVLRALLTSLVAKCSSLCDTLRFEWTGDGEYTLAVLRSGMVLCVGMPGASFHVRCPTQAAFAPVLRQRKNWFLLLGDSDAQ